MEKLSDNNIKGICTVKELVSRLKLSRARFYQLQNRGVFPKPDRCGRSNRPFYTPDMQRKCLEIRRTGIGYDGEPVVFNAPRQRESRRRRWTASRENGQTCFPFRRERK